MLDTKENDGAYLSEMLHQLSARWRHSRLLLAPLGLVLGAIYFVLGVPAFVRDNFLSPTTRAEWDTYKFIPHWPITWWIIVGLAILVVGIFEGSYRMRNTPGSATDSRAKLVSDARQIAKRVRIIRGRFDQEMSAADPEEGKAEQLKQIQDRRATRFRLAMDRAANDYKAQVGTRAIFVRDALLTELVVPPMSRPLGLYVNTAYEHANSQHMFEAVADDLELLAHEVEAKMLRET